MLVRRWCRMVAQVCAVAVMALGIVGCESGTQSGAPAAAKSGDDHGHSHEGLAIANFGESVGTLRKFHDQIKAAFDKNAPDEAHDALHEVGHVLEAIEKQVETLTEDKREAAKAAVKALFDGYGKIDGAMHGGDEVKYADLGADLSKNVEALEAAK